MKIVAATIKRELSEGTGLFLFALLFLALSLYGVLVFQQNFPATKMETRLPASPSVVVDGK